MKIVFVCTGNICRSPTAEGVLRHKLAEAGLESEHETESYGLGGWHVGDPPDSRAVAAAAERGYDLSEIRARKFKAKAFRDAGLVLAMDRGHYRQLFSLAPEGTADRLFHFLEFAPDAHQAPGLARLDVPDPYYGGAEGFEHTLDLIEAGAEGILQALRQGRL
jgi:protein-tyrosine phosphatase